MATWEGKPTLASVLKDYIPPTESALADPIKEHFRTLPQQLAQNQAAMDSAMGSWNKTDFATGQPNPNYRPEAIQELTQLMPNVGALTAWHGTPHKIVGKFDINKVGTGEGAQAYGHGMYFAESPSVATQYRNILSKPEFTKNAQGMEMRGQLPRMLDESYSELISKNGIQQTNYGDVTDIVGQRLDRQMKDALKAKDMDWYNKTADMKLDLARFKESPPANTGNLYKVDIPDADIPNMLDWDKPFKDQTPSVQAAIKQLEPKIKQINPNLNVENLDGKGIYHAYQQYRGNQPDFASEGMNELGIKGIRYLDQGSRNPGFSSLTPTQLQSRIESLQTDIKSGGGNQAKMKDQLKALQNEIESYKNMTSNFVVFEPSTVKILEENSKPLSRKEVIEQELKKRVK